MEFYWDEVEDNSYILYEKENAYPLLELYYCEDCNCYHCESETFDFYEDYDCEENGISDENELLLMVQEDIINDLKFKILYILELICGLSKIEK